MTKIQNSKLFRTLEFRILRLFRISDFGFRISRSPSERGQIALIMVLIMVVMLTVGMGVARRGTTDVHISAQEEDSARAFQAAEAGVEQALSTLTSGSGSFGEDTTYQVTATQAGDSGFVMNQPIAAGEGLLVNLEEASVNLSQLEIYFNEKGRDDCTTNPAAIEVSVVYYELGDEVRVRREAFDMMDRQNGFELADTGEYSYEGKTFCAKARVSLTGNDQQVRIKPVYNRAILGVKARPNNATLGQQYFRVESVGKTESGLVRAVEVQRLEPQLPPIFDYALFSGGGIVKGE